jgi:hypothetical protein
MKIAVELLKLTRILYSRLIELSDRRPRLAIDYHGQAASDYVKEMLTSANPCMICRFGSHELNAILNYLDIIGNGGYISKSIKYIRSEIGPFWWDDEIRSLMLNNAGFFPADAEYLERFANIILNDIRNIDVLGSWLMGEVRLANFITNATIVPLIDLEPYYHTNPWSEALEGKRVLVIHPFEESISKQYKKHGLLFKDPRVLPKFDLITFKAVQSIAGNNTQFSSWFDALSHMSKKISRISFDIAIIGAGAYGLPLASFVKRIGKKGIHLGGATQVLFGIKGKRWDNLPFFRRLYNENWVRPLPSETPENFQIVESGCYW